jgi:uncharacterized protein YecA (UPF0149 family)
MLVTFKSKGAPNILMYEEHAKRMLDVLGKDVKRGVITKDEAALAIEKLQSEIAVDASHHDQEDVQDASAQGTDTEHEQAQNVAFATRAYPLLEMLREAKQHGYDVLWGV